MFLFSMFVSGCSDSKDINEKTILTAVAMDKKGDDIILYVEIANIEGGKKSGDGGGSADNKFIYIKSHGKTIPEARENLNQQLDKPAYLSAIRTLILTEEFAKEYLVEYLYRVRVDESYRKKTAIVITKEDPEKLFKTINEKNISVGFSTEEMLMTLDEEGESFLRTTSRIIENLSSSYTGLLLPSIGLQDKETLLVGYSVINNETIDGFIPIEESKGVIFLKASKPKFYYTVPYKDNKFTIEVALKNRKIKPQYDSGKINFDLNFTFEAKLMYGDKKTPYKFDTAANAKVTKILTDMLKKEITNTVEQAQKKYECDYLQFEDEFRIKFPVEYEDMNWEKEFSKAKFNTEVKVVLTSAWTMDYETGKIK